MGFRKMIHNHVLRRGQGPPAGIEFSKKYGI